MDWDALTADDLIAFASLAECYVHQNRIEEARGWLTPLLELDPANAEFHAVMGLVCYRQGEWDAAEDHLLQALALKDPFPQAYGYLGHLEGVRGNFDQQGRLYRHALAQDATIPATQMAMGMWLMRHGQWRRGWALYEGRLGTPGFREGHGDYPGLRRWAGEPLAGRTIIVTPEQGLGDGFMAARYLRNLVQTGAHVWWAVGPGVKPLAQACREALGLAGVLAFGDLIPEADYQVSILSLPHLTNDPVPRWDGPYLPIPLAPVAGRVGYVYAGNPKLVNDRHRSIPRELFMRMVGQGWVSLQVGDGFQPRDWLETAELVATCERVVTVDTAACHLAGAMGVPVTLLSPANGDFRWGRTTCPDWYGPTFKLVRQQRLGDWGSVIDGIVSRETPCRSDAGRLDTSTVRT